MFRSKIRNGKLHGKGFSGSEANDWAGGNVWTGIQVVPAAAAQSVHATNSRQPEVSRILENDSRASVATRPPGSTWVSRPTWRDRVESHGSITRTSATDQPDWPSPQPFTSVRDDPGEISFASRRRAEETQFSKWYAQKYSYTCPFTVGGSLCENSFAWGEPS